MSFLKWFKPAPPAKPVRHPLYFEYSSESSRKYEVTPEEEVFFAAFDEALAQGHLIRHFSLTRMGNGAISVRTRHAYVGKIKLQGRKTWMQYMTSLYDADVAENQTLDEYIQLLRYWVKAERAGEAAYKSALEL